MQSQPITHPFTCGSCGITFYRPAHRRPKFCSQRCNGRAKSTPLSESTRAVRIICEFCGTPFYRYQSRSKNAGFCKRACRHAAQAALIDARIAAQVDVTTTPDGCHPWTGWRDADGYGSISYKSKNQLVTRIIFERMTGITLTRDDLICHTCDYPPCCRFVHFFKSDADGNSKDMVAKGRSMRGEQHHKARLTETNILDIRARHAKGVSAYALGKEYGVHDTHIARIVRREAWPHV